MRKRTPKALPRVPINVQRDLAPALRAGVIKPIADTDTFDYAAYTRAVHAAVRKHTKPKRGQRT